MLRALTQVTATTQITDHQRREVRSSLGPAPRGQPRSPAAVAAAFPRPLEHGAVGGGGLQNPSRCPRSSQRLGSKPRVPSPSSRPPVGAVGGGAARSLGTAGSPGRPWGAPAAAPRPPGPCPALTSGSSPSAGSHRPPRHLLGRQLGVLSRVSSPLFSPRSCSRRSFPACFPFCCRALG